MSEASVVIDDITTARRYSTFARRMRAMVIDFFVVMSAGIVGMLLLDLVEADLAARAYVILLFGLAFLYDPVLVSTTGATLGHRAVNIRVVDRDADRRIGFVRAVVRFALKVILGFLSFFFLAITRRHQALHDLVMRSVVVVNDPARAEPGEYVLAKAPLLTMVSRTRRVLMILVYTAAWFVLTVPVASLIISDDCMVNDRCTRFDDSVATGLGLLLMLGLGSFLVLGWQARLPGARARTQAVPEPVRSAESESEALPPPR
jgi:uncharacterized RDD family membrane protein YckC